MSEQSFPPPAEDARIQAEALFAAQRAERRERFAPAIEALDEGFKTLKEAVESGQAEFERPPVTDAQGTVTEARVKTPWLDDVDDLGVSQQLRLRGSYSLKPDGSVHRSLSVEKPDPHGTSLGAPQNVGSIWEHSGDNMYEAGVVTYGTGDVKGDPASNAAKEVYKLIRHLGQNLTEPS